MKRRTEKGNVSSTTKKVCFGNLKKTYIHTFSYLEDIISTFLPHILVYISKKNFRQGYMTVMEET